jgi:hypothetical protein
MYLSTRVRTLNPGEDYPEDLAMGFFGSSLQREWCWLAENEQEVLGGLMCSPMHGALLMLRASVKGGAPRTTLRALLRTAVLDAKRRGCNGYISLLDPTTETGRKLFGIVRNVGGVQWPGPLIMVWGRFEGVA